MSKDKSVWDGFRQRVRVQGTGEMYWVAYWEDRWVANRKLMGAYPTVSPTPHMLFGFYTVRELREFVLRLQAVCSRTPTSGLKTLAKEVRSRALKGEIAFERFDAPEKFNGEVSWNEGQEGAA